VAYPGFVPAFIRPRFCEGQGPFRWVALSGDPEDIYATDRALMDAFRDNAHLVHWLRLAHERVQFQGLPARICWLGYGERATAGRIFNDLVATGRVRAPIVIGRDHLDSGSVASPNRETESMRDGSDAIADWPILNALVNTAAGATWVSVHHGGGVGIGYSIHAGMVVVADGSPDAARRLERVLTTDPGTGIMRHADAGYPEAIAGARRHGLDLPGIASGGWGRCPRLRRLPQPPDLRGLARGGVRAPRERRDVPGDRGGGRRHPLHRARHAGGERRRAGRARAAAPRDRARARHDDARGQVGLRAHDAGRAQDARRRAPPGRAPARCAPRDLLRRA